jgi:hypothetical protein
MKRLIVDFAVIFISITSTSRNKLDFPTRIEIIHGSHSLLNVLTWVLLFSLHFIITHVKTGCKLWLP